MNKNMLDESAKELKAFSSTKKSYAKYGVTVSHIKNNKSESYIINCQDLHLLGQGCEKYVSGVFKSKLKELISHCKVAGDKILFVGLGNPDILCDRLGELVIKRIDMLGNNNLYSLCPDIELNTNINSYELTKSVVELKDIDLVIVIDSLATVSTSRIGVSFQMTNEGITAGSALHDLGKSFSYKSLKVPCIAIGVPLMIFASSLTKNAPPEMVLAPKDLRTQIERCACIIADAINAL